MILITDKQRELLDKICELIEVNNGIPPTIREMAESLGYEHYSAVSGMLLALEKKRYIRRVSGKSRGLQVLRTS